MLFLILADTVSAVTADVNALVPAVLELLGEILTVLTKAKADIEAALSSGVVALVLNGKVLDIAAIAQLVGALICVRLFLLSSPSYK
jgi:energy-converting hydrogenase Eha subunit C